MTARINLREGVKYRFRYKQQAGNYQWYEHTMIATYVGEGKYDEHILSLRPLAGTQELKHEQVLWIDEMPKNMEVQLPKKVGKHQPK